MIVAAIGCSLLAIVNRINGTDLVTIGSSSFKFEGFRSGAHLLLELLAEHIGMTAKEIRHPVNERQIVIMGNMRHTRPLA